MEATLFHAVLCPVGEKPAETNVEHVHVISADISSALSYVSKRFPERSLVSLSLAQPVYLDGTLVDFE